ncbi:MAG: MFS transporter [Anaerolineae bacterium]|nr:MFS transporter [Anaerolineae bacterium]
MTDSDYQSSRGLFDLHYGWVILAVAVLTVMGCLGLARFGYTMILPAMQSDLALSNTQTGGLATGNFVGYLALAVIGGAIASRYGARRVIGISMFLAGVTMMLTGVASSFQTALVWRVLTGIGSGGSNVPVMSVLPAWFSPRRRGLAAGMAVGGSGLALIITGLLVPQLLEGFGANGWRYSWLVLGASVVGLGVLAFVLLRDRPEEKNLRPIGAEPQSAPTAVGAGLAPNPAPRSIAPLKWGRVYRSGVIWHLALVYVAFGFSYVIYATFFAKYLQSEAGYTKEAAGSLWAVVGWLSIFSGLAWGALSDRIGRKYGLALVYLAQAVCYLVFALWHAPVGYTVSAILFGLTGWSIPGIVAAACGDYVGPSLAPAALGFVTLFFGIGQAVGPSVAGAFADATGSFGPAFLVAASVALLGSVGSLLLRRPLDEPSL